MTNNYHVIITIIIMINHYRIIIITNMVMLMTHAHGNALVQD